MRIVPSGATLGARIEDVDLGREPTAAEFKQILRALGRHGVLCFPGQTFDADALSRFGAMFGELEINIANQLHEPGHPEVMILSNMKKDGKPLGGVTVSFYKKIAATEKEKEKTQFVSDAVTDADGKFVNDMADEITIDDPSNLTVKLKTGQTFTDGSEVTADPPRGAGDRLRARSAVLT